MSAPTTFVPQAQYGHRDFGSVWRKWYEVRLNVPQHVAVMAGVSYSTAFLSRPIFNGHWLYFLSQSSLDMPPARKRQRMIDAMTSNWFAESQFGHGSVLRHGTGLFGSLLTFNLFDRATESYVPWWLRGYVAGAASGFSIALVKHPLDVLEATAKAPGPKEFTGPFDVLKTTIVHKPQALPQLFNGFVMASLGSMLSYAAFFGIYRQFEYDGYRNTDLRLLTYCYCASVMSELIRYPFRHLREELKKLQSANKFKPASYFYIVQKWRKSDGITMVFNGFFASHPLLRSWGSAWFLFAYTHALQRYSGYLESSSEDGWSRVPE